MSEGRIILKSFFVKNISSLEKVLPKPNLTASRQNMASCLMGERFSYQIAFIGDAGIHGEKKVKIRIESDIEDKIRLYDVKCVPVQMPAYLEEYDEDYISRSVGVFPDVLVPNCGTVTVSAYYYKSIWVSVEGAPCGKHKIDVFFEDSSNEYSGKSSFELNVINKALPPQRLIFTQWFHCDCISSYYGLEPLSEAHWEYIDRFMKLASEGGINMLMTPIFTLALDTEVGGERPTVQLVDIACDKGEYRFDFTKLKRWLLLCAKNNIEYIELSPLFTQWGAEHTPKIEISEDGKRVKKFGWHTDSLSDEYKSFLSCFIPALISYLKENWDISKVYYHISDEPNERHLERYGRVHDFIKPYMSEIKHIDALSSVDFYKKGYVDEPVSSTIVINNFIDAKVENLWAYYCCGEGKYNLSNRFIAMPSYRNRIIGVQLYKYGIKGFLQWGYNFYYSFDSGKLLNPFIENDGDGLFPAGDAFSVYPGNDGPLASLRFYVFAEALADMRAFELLESYIGREEVLKLIDADGEITFNSYPKSEDYIISLRERVNKLIEENMK